MESIVARTSEVADAHPKSRFSIARERSPRSRIPRQARTKWDAKRGDPSRPRLQHRGSDNRNTQALKCQRCFPPQARANSQRKTTNTRPFKKPGRGGILSRCVRIPLDSESSQQTKTQMSARRDSTTGPSIETVGEVSQHKSTSSCERGVSSTHKAA